MNKGKFILSVVTVVVLAGCSRAEVEKNPVVIKDVLSLEDGIKKETSQETSTKGEATKDEKKDANVSQTEEPTTFTIEIEGMKEEVKGLGHTGDGYEIVYDSDRFEYSDKNGVDNFIAQNADPAIYPYVYLCINHLNNKSVSDYVEKLSDTLSANNFKLEITKDVSIGTYKGTIVKAKAGTEWNSIIRDYYIIKNGTSIYTIEAQYFVEAEEGYGARIQAMVNTFKILQ